MLSLHYFQSNIHVKFNFKLFASQLFGNTVALTVWIIHSTCVFSSVKTRQRQMFTHVCSKGSHNNQWHTLCIVDRWRAACRDTVLLLDHMWSLWNQTGHSCKAELHHYMQLQESGQSLCRTVKKFWGWRHRKIHGFTFITVITARGHHLQKLILYCLFL